ncbi:MAG: Gfo/Idh/MocA family oxidoreductase [Clostridiales bacterium]|nr:Gfo/Idh/MocA family oxidoreductase [Clostridiales bacterium]
MRTGIVGCGSIAAVHAFCLEQMDDCELVGFADVKKDRAEQFARKYGGKAYDSLEGMLWQESLDVLHICTPHYLHVPMALYGLSHSVHVFMEKPPAISKEQLEELEEAVKTTQKRMGFCFQNRYNPCVQTVRELLQTEAGSVKGARGLLTWSRSAEYYTENAWRGRWKTEGGGALMNQAIHTMDLLVYLLGSPQWVDARMSNHHLKQVIEVEDSVEAQIRIADRPVCFYATTAYCADMPPMIEIACENMTIRMEDPDVTIVYPDGRAEKKRGERSVSIGKSCWGSGHMRCIASFYEKLKTGEAFEAELPGGCGIQ